MLEKATFEPAAFVAALILKPDKSFDMKFTELCDRIFTKSVTAYHLTDNVDAPMPEPYEKGSLEMLLFHKNWVDTVQWHLEDIIREPSIDPLEALAIKRRIDKSNQVRTDMVEFIDGYFLDKFKDVKPKADARLNTETVAWAVDRYSILYLKMYHMKVEADRMDASDEHRASCAKKLDVLKTQHKDLTEAIEQLLEDIVEGNRIVKTYKQMKMYNDPALNPVLYAKK